ncbi:Hypothetical protein SMAX5B_004068 [Scophthalmus maximus]|uniref:Uncharacterized protein n=1 Tax=Scophthalmus maximus TaxID=52904 RepID=A0A2U9B8A2_SCOMX|nr:Hypothetical protein SMAX5B_004068 [Scophthalmus maximus]
MGAKCAYSCNPGERREERAGHFAAVQRHRKGVVPSGLQAEPRTSRRNTALGRAFVLHVALLQSVSL